MNPTFAAASGVPMERGNLVGAVGINSNTTNCHNPVLLLRNDYVGVLFSTIGQIGVSSCSVLEKETQHIYALVTTVGQLPILSIYAAKGRTRQKHKLTPTATMVLKVNGGTNSTSVYMQYRTHRVRLRQPYPHSFSSGIAQEGERHSLFP